MNDAIVKWSAPRLVNACASELDTYGERVRSCLRGVDAAQTVMYVHHVTEAVLNIPGELAAAESAAEESGLLNSMPPFRI